MNMCEAEEVVVCPYNKAHSILKGRIQFHLARCRVQHRCLEMVSCPYDSTHVVPKLELELHMKSCSNRIVLDSFLYQVGNTECPVKDTVPINTLDLPPPKENWDEDPDTDVSVLDSVKEKVQDKGVLLNLIGAPKSARKAHRIRERERYQRVICENPVPQVIVEVVDRAPPRRNVRLPCPRRSDTDESGSELSSSSEMASSERSSNSSAESEDTRILTEGVSRLEVGREEYREERNVAGSISSGGGGSAAAAGAAGGGGSLSFAAIAARGRCDRPIAADRPGRGSAFMLPVTRRGGWRS